MSVGSADIGGFGSVKGEGVPGGGTPITSIVVDANDSQLKVTTVGNTSTIQQFIAAGWPVPIPRIYAVDGALGNDASKGFADPVSTSPTDYEAACAAAGAVAKKTLAGLAAIFPLFGDGRQVVILIKAGTYVGGLGTFLSGCYGYQDGSPLVRGTVTDATASSVAFAGDANDATMAGGIRIPGLNNAGYNPTGVPTTSVIQLVKVGGGGPAFAADPAVPTGWRVRFASNTPTVALRNACAQVANHTGGDTIQLQFDLPAVPATGIGADICYLEKAGVLVDGSTVAPAINSISNTSFVGGGAQIVGIDQTGPYTGAEAHFNFFFCGGTKFTVVDSVFQSSSFYVDPILGFLGVGGGIRLSLSSDITGCISGYSSNAFGALLGLICEQDLRFVQPVSLIWTAGSAARKVTIEGAVLVANNSNNDVANLGSTGFTTGIPRIFGGSAQPLVLIDSQLRIEDLTITGAGNFPAIQPFGRNNIELTGALSGSAGNNDVGIDFQFSVQTNLVLAAGTVPTVTGGAGDVRWCGQALAAWTNFNFQEGWDIAGNHIVEFVTNGSYKHATSPSVSLCVNNSGAAIATAYQLVQNNGTNLQVVPAQADTMAHASSFAGICEAVAANGAACLVAAPEGYRICRFDAAPTVGAIAYLSKLTAGAATTTVPTVSVTAVKLRLGIVVGNSFPGNIGLVRWTPEVLPVLADGLA